MNEEEIKEKILLKLKKHNLNNLQDQNEYGLNALMFCLKYNKTMNLGLDNEEWDYLINHSNLKQQDNLGYNAFMYALENNKSQNILLRKKQFYNLLEKTDLKQNTKNNSNSLMYYFSNNKKENLFFSEKKVDYLLKNSDLSFSNENTNILIYALNYFEAQNINLTTKQWDYLIRNSDIKQKMNDKTSLIYFIFFNNRKEINMEENTLNYFIENSDVHHQDQSGWTAFLYAFRIIEKNPKNESYIKKIYSCLNEEEKQETFYKICEKYIGITKEFNQNHILFMLYDLQMKPKEEILEKLNKDERYQDKLIKNQYQELLRMIEKRNVLWDLNKNLNQEKNKKDVLKI
jgi:hypothetical protein